MTSPLDIEESQISPGFEEDHCQGASSSLRRKLESLQKGAPAHACADRVAEDDL